MEARAQAPGATETPRRARLAAGVTGVAAFPFLLLSFPGLLNDHFMHLAWAQELRLGAWPGLDFVDPGWPLQYALSAVALSGGLLGEIVLVSALLAVAAAATCLGVAWLTRSTTAGVAAALLQVALEPRLYSYPKVLVPALLLVVGMGYARGDRWSRAGLAGSVALAFLLRHDLGAYAAVFAAVVAVAAETSWRRGCREAARLGGLTVLVLAPYLVYVQSTEGLLLHVYHGAQFAAGEPGFGFDWPRLLAGAAPLWSDANAAVVLFYLLYALPVLVVLLLAWRPRQSGRADRAVILGLAALAAVYDAVILRTPIAARVPDLSAVFAILGTWSVVELRRRLGSLAVGRRRAATASLALAAVAIIAVVGSFAHVPTQWLRTGLPGGPAATAGRVASLVEGGTTWPWRDLWPGGNLPDVVEYLDRCTGPSDRLFMTWFAPEYYVFARRGMAGGHAFLLPPAFSSSADQQRTLDRLRRQRVPVVLLHENQRAEFEARYPLVAAEVNERYRRAGGFALPNDVRVSLLVHRDWIGRGTFEDTGWPCALAPRPA